MSIQRFIVILIAAMICVSANIVAQNDPTPSFREIPRFYVDLLSYASDSSGRSRLDMYLEVPHQMLQFTREGDVFHASYEVSLTIFDSTGLQVAESFWREDVDTKEFEETVSLRSGKLSQKTFLLPEGKFTVQTQVRDSETKKSSLLKRIIHVKNYSSTALSISDLMLISRLSMEDEKKIVYPNITGNMGELKDGFYIFFEGYNRLAADSINITMNIKNMKGEVAWRDSIRQYIPTGKKSFFPKIHSAQLIAGDYTLEIQARLRSDSIGSSSQEPTATSLRSFVIRLRGVPASIADLDLAIDQLQYITDGDNIEEMKQLPSEEKKLRFQEFWKKKDPSPNTERNELMEEYYGRVEYANKNFGHYADGWKTDRGMVYVIFGAPNNIERHPFDIDAKPYEIWTYYQIDREFIFVDTTGFGDYRLQTPIWDVWRTRPR